MANGYLELTDENGQIRCLEIIAICCQTANLVRNALLLSDLGFVTVRGRTGQEHVFGIK